MWEGCSRIQVDLWYVDFADPGGVWGEGEVGGGGGLERGLVGDEGAHEGLVDVGDGEVEGDVLGLVGHVEGDDDVVVAGRRGADVGEDARGWWCRA